MSPDNQELLSEDGDSDTEFQIPFGLLSTEEKQDRLMYLWKKTIKRAYGASQIVMKLKHIKEKILLFGIPREDSKRNNLIKTITPKCIIKPDDPIKQYWTLYISILLIYSVIFVPVKVSFYDESSMNMIIWDFIVDASFATDIVLTFFSGYERKDQTIETDKRVIATQYLKMWFWIDVLSTLPVGIFELPFF